MQAASTSILQLWPGIVLLMLAGRAHAQGSDAPEGMFRAFNCCLIATGKHVGKNLSLCMHVFTLAMTIEGSGSGHPDKLLGYLAAQDASGTHQTSSPRMN